MKKLLILGVLCLAATRVHGAAQYITGLELSTAPMEGTITGSNAGGGAMASAEQFRSGGFSFKSSATAATSNLAQRTLAGDTVQNIYMGAHIYISSTPSAITDLMRYESAAAASECRWRLAQNRTGECWSSSGKLGSSSVAIASNTWTQIGTYYNEGSNVCVCQAAGVTFSSAAANDLGGGAQFRWGIQTSVTGVVYMDDLYAFDDTGVTQSTWTLAKIGRLKPNGAGDQTLSISTGGTGPAVTAWQSVDEVLPNEGVDVASMTATTSVMDLTMEDASTAGIGSEDTIQLVAVGARLAAASAANCTWRPGLKTQVNGVVSSGTLTTVAVATYFSHDDTANTRAQKLFQAVDPQAGGAWTSTLLDSLQVRTFTSDATPVVQISTVWVDVMYLDNAPASGRKRRFVVMKPSGGRVGDFLPPGELRPAALFEVRL